MWRTLRYRRGDTTVVINNSDIRVPHEWTVRLNDEVIGENWDDFEQGLTEALDEVARRISRLR